MLTQNVIDRLERVDDHFGTISSNLVHVCEELPSLGIPKDVEERIVGFCCSFLEHLVEEDKQVGRIATGLKGNVDRIPQTPCAPPDGAPRTIENTEHELGRNIKSMQELVAEIRSLAGQQTRLATLSVLLKESSDSILKTFEGIRAEFKGLLDGWTERSVH